MARSIEAFATYHRQKESLTEYLQVSAAGLALLRRNVEVSNGPTLLGALVDACGVTHWSTGKRFSNAVSKVDTGILALADQGVIQHVAAFDIFTRSAIQDLAMFSSRARAANPELDHDHSLLRLSSNGRWVSHHCCHDLAGRLGTLSQRIAELSSWTGWAPSAKLAPILPLYDLARSVRNKIAHDGGIVGADLETLSMGHGVQTALAAFRASYTRADLPELPRFKRGKPLNLNVVHAILFGAVLYEIAREINDYASGLVDDAEFIDMAFYYSCIVDEHPFRKSRYRFAENRVNHFVSERYLRQRISPGNSTVIARLMGQTAGAGAAETTYWEIARGAHAQLQAQ